MTHPEMEWLMKGAAICLSRLSNQVVTIEAMGTMVKASPQEAVIPNDGVTLVVDLDRMSPRQSVGPKWLGQADPGYRGETRMIEGFEGDMGLRL